MRLPERPATPAPFSRRFWKLRNPFRREPAQIVPQKGLEAARACPRRGIANSKACGSIVVRHRHPVSRCGLLWFRWGVRGRAQTLGAPRKATRPHCDRDAV